MQSVSALRRQRQRLARELLKLSHLIKGSFFQRFSTCSRSGCSCHRGEPHGPRAYLTIMMGRKQRQLYVPKDRVQSARAAVEQYQRLVQLVERISHINLKLFKRGALDDSDH